MNSQLKKLLIGAAVLALLAGVYFLGAGNKKDEQEEIVQTSEEEENDVLGQEADNIEQAVIKRKTDTIELAKNSEGLWCIKGYEDVEFDQGEIGSVASSLSSLNFTQKISDISQTPTAEELAPYGLDEPDAAAWVKYKDGTEKTIYIGSSTSDTAYNYAMLEGGDGIYIVDYIYADRYKKTINSLIDKSIPSISSLSVLYVDVLQKGRDEIEIEYDSVGGSQELASYGMQTLTMKKPLAGAAVYPPNLQETILSSLSELRLGDAADIKPDDLAKYGLTQEDAYIKIKLRDESNELTLTVGKEADDENYYCVAEGKKSVFKISKSLIEPFENADIIDFIQKFVALVPRKDVKQVRFKGFGGEYEITFKDNPDEEQTDDDDTRIGCLNGKGLEDAAFANLYQQLIGITFDTITQGNEIGDVPDAQIVYTLLDGSERKVEFYSIEQDKNFYAAKIDGDTSRLVHERGVRELFNLAQKLAA